MAIDSRQKRAAVIGTARAWYRNPHPSGINASQRASIAQVYPVAVFQGADPPVFSGTIPDISEIEGTGSHSYDLSTYFTNAATYSISPAVEAGWSFNTSTAELIIDTDDVNSFGPFTVSGHSLGGSEGDVLLSEQFGVDTGGAVASSCALSIDSQRLKHVSDPGFSPTTAHWELTVVSGQQITINLDFIVGLTGSGQIWVGSGTFGPSRTNIGTSSIALVDETLTLTVTPAVTTIYIHAVLLGSGADGYWDNLLVYEGNGGSTSNAFGVEVTEAPVVEVEDGASGGWWYAYDYEYNARKRKKEELKALEAKAEQIQNDVDREIAKELRAQDKERERIDELRRLSKLAAAHREELQQSVSQKAILAAENAMIKGTYSAMEQLERELARSREEELFLLQAASIILNS